VAALSQALQRAIATPDVHTIVFQGDGKHFCTGFDLSNLDDESEGDLLYRFVQIEQLLSNIWHAPVRTVAFGHGRVLGAGADIFTACDIRVARADASFLFPGAAFGLILGTRRLQERVGADCALRWTSTGASINHQDALAAGLVNQVSDEAAERNWARLRTDRSTFSALRAATTSDQRDRDLAALIKSIMKSGLKARLQAHRDRVIAATAQRERSTPL